MSTVSGDRQTLGCCMEQYLAFGGARFEASNSSRCCCAPYWAPPRKRALPPCGARRNQWLPARASPGNGRQTGFGWPPATTTGAHHKSPKALCSSLSRARLRLLLRISRTSAQATCCCTAQEEDRPSSRSGRRRSSKHRVRTSAVQRRLGHKPQGSHASHCHDPLGCDHADNCEGWQS